MLYRHSDQMVTQQIEKMRGGQGVATVKNLLNPDEMLGKGRLFAQNTLPPGASACIGTRATSRSITCFPAAASIATTTNRLPSAPAT